MTPIPLEEDLEKELMKMPELETQEDELIHPNHAMYNRFETVEQYHCSLIRRVPKKYHQEFVDDYEKWKEQQDNKEQEEELNKLETLSQKIADYCTEQDLPKWYTVDELLELHQSCDYGLTYNQKEQLYKFKEQLEEL